MEIHKYNVVKPLIIFIILSSIWSISNVRCHDGESVRELPYCGPNNKSSTQGHKELVIVSTLDGRLSALDPTNDGLLKWSVNTGPGPMLSSSIHRLELTNNGHWVRMIPSLSGGLYKFDGDSIETIPITADTLLKSSAFLFSDDLVISGGKESRTYGVALKTGQVLYECSMTGCDNLKENISDDEEMLVVQRKTQTVRAVEVRTGGERWNFSVGLHDLKLMSDVNSNCHDPSQDSARLPSAVELKVIVPEGLVCAVSKSSGRNIIWKHKFDTPIVTAWHLTQGEMRDVDLFSGSQWSPQNKPDDIRPLSPTLYVGMHQKQLYIQESVNMQILLQTVLTSESPQYPRLPWVPVPASSNALGLTSLADDGEPSVMWPSDDTTSTTALSILYGSEYVNGNGFYLFSEDTVNMTKRAQCNVPNVTIEIDDVEIEDNLDEGTPVQVIMVSLWHWWKEVLIISITTAAVVNLMINRNLITMIHRGITREVIRKEIIVVEKHVPVPQDIHFGSNHKRMDRTSSESSQPQASEYTSRYLTDFHQVNCLGKGGFGVVFEAKNKIDDCHYAIKRIALPNKQESRDRVLREVKALAKLEHTNIVRYFNAWLEFPPHGWEEEQNENPQNNSFVEEGYSSGNADQTRSHLKPLKQFVNNSNISETTSLGYKNIPNQTNDSSVELLQWNNNFDKLIDLASPLHNNSVLDKSDSYIVFEAPDPEEQDGESVHPTNQDESVIFMASSSSGNDLKSVTTWESNGKHNKLGIVKQKTHKRPSSLDFSQSFASSLTPSPTRVYLFIQMQLCRKESLREWLLENTCQRDCFKVLQIFEQIVQAVEYVHLQGLIHRDLKPSNIFFSPDGQIKVGDFGLVTAMVENGDEQRTPSKDSAKLPYQTHTAQVGTQLYMSPEQLMGMCYNYKVDIYSLGLILFELLVPFNTQMERGRTLTDLRRNKFPQDFPQNYQLEYELLRLMLSHNPEDRPTTLGIRAKPPLCQSSSKAVDEQWHFELPQRRDSSKSLSNSSSLDSSSWEQVV